MDKANVLPAIGAGFRLIVREPLSVLAWGLLASLLTLVPTMLYFNALGPAYFDMITSLTANPGAPPAMPPGMATAYALQPLQFVGAIANMAIVYPAILRAVIFPEERRWAYLRFGMTELFVGIIGVVLWILFFIAIVFLMLIVGIPIFIAIGLSMAGGGQPGAGGAIVVVIALLAGLGLFIAAAYVFGRLWMGAPMTVATGQLKLFDGWVFTRGYGFGLLGMSVIIVLVMLLVELVLIAILGIGLIGMLSAKGPAAVEALFTRANLQKWFGGIVAGYAAFGAIMITLTGPIMMAPWARAYQIIAKVNNREAGEVFA